MFKIRFVDFSDLVSYIHISNDAKESWWKVSFPVLPNMVAGFHPMITCLCLLPEMVQASEMKYKDTNPLPLRWIPSRCQLRLYWDQRYLTVTGGGQEVLGSRKQDSKMNHKGSSDQVSQLGVGVGKTEQICSSLQHIRISRTCADLACPPTLSADCMQVTLLPHPVPKSSVKGRSEDALCTNTVWLQGETVLRSSHSSPDPSFFSEGYWHWWEDDLPWKSSTS